MRWIFRYTPKAKQYISRITKTKLPESQPWLHIAVKTVSNRNPWCGVVIYIWDTRQVIYEHRFNNNVLTKDMFTIAKSGMTRALDNREPLKGGRRDCNQFFEFGETFDASHGKVFDGKDRIVKTDLYKRRAKKAGMEDFSDADGAIGFAEIVSDNTSLAPDVDSTGTGDDQCELGSWQYKDMTGNKYCIVPKGRQYCLYRQNCRGPIDMNASQSRLIKMYRLQTI
jgi:hypothetical protein